VKKTVAPKSTSTKTAKKTPTPSAAGDNGRASIAVLVVEGPPLLQLPGIPAGFKAPGKIVMSHYRKPTEPQREETQDVIDELNDSPDYTKDFTINAPPAKAIANALQVATDWDAVYDEMTTYAAYALAMRALSWDAALRPVARLETRYDAAASDDPAIAKKYPKTATFFGARTEVAARGAVTRKENKKRAKAAAANASAASVTSTTSH